MFEAKAKKREISDFTHEKIPAQNEQLLLLEHYYLMEE